MITIHAERCNGCGGCLEVCPNGALYLLAGKAVVDEALCQECEACVVACPTQAIVIVEQVPEPVSVRVPAIRPGPEIIRVETETALMPLRAKVLPVMSAALIWAGREIVPRLADYFLDSLDRRAAQRQAPSIARGTSNTNAQSRRRGGGRRHRRRRRGN